MDNEIEIIANPTDTLTIYLANPRGFCAGVDRAVLIVEKALQFYGQPIYVKHEIVHNMHVVDRLKKLGAIFTEDLTQIPPGSRVIFSAHGVSPAVREVAKQRKFLLLDATCPLVTKVHKEAVRYDLLGYQIVFIGHTDHVETQGTVGHAPENIVVISTEEEVDTLNLDNSKPIVYLTQTTLSLDDTKQIIDRLKQKYPQIEELGKEDICYATTNRQNAVKAMTKFVDLLLVVGSNFSSNTMRLLETGQKKGTPTYLVQDVEDVDPDWFITARKIGLTAGASAPESLVQQIADRVLQIKPGRKQFFDYIQEDVHFPLPYAIRKLMDEQKNRKKTTQNSAHL